MCVWSYCSAVGNFQVMGGFQALTKPSMWVHTNNFYINSTCLRKEKLKSESFMINRWWFSRRDLFGKGPELLQKLSECGEENLTTADLLVVLFYLPARHLHEYSRLLLKLATCFEVVGGRNLSSSACDLKVCILLFPLFTNIRFHLVLSFLHSLISLFYSNFHISSLINTGIQEIICILTKYIKMFFFLK